VFQKLTGVSGSKCDSFRLSNNATFPVAVRQPYQNGNYNKISIMSILFKSTIVMSHLSHFEDNDSDRDGLF
jgi:hypothetical protein